MRLFKRLRNKGFTLVEVIVALAVFTIVGGAITSFMVVSQKQYNNGSAETDLQYEAQLVVNQISDLIIDAAKGVSYKYVGSLADGTAVDGLVLEDVSGGAATTKELYVYNEDYYYKLFWSETDKELLFSKYEVANASNKIEDQLLAQFVSAFSVDLKELESRKTIKFTITFTKAATGRTYTTSHQVKLRNDVLLNKSYAEVYVPGAQEIVATGIDVYPETLVLWPGDSEKVAAKVTSNVGLMPSQTVTWEFKRYGADEPVTDSDTKVTANTLFLGGNEQGGTVEGLPHRIDLVAKQGSLESDPIRVGVRTITDISTRAYLEESNFGLGASAGGETEYTVNVSEGQQDVCISVANFAGANIGDLLVSDLGTKISNMGGITISGAAGIEEYLSFEASFAEAEGSGVLKFDVKDGIVFPAGQNTATVAVTFECDRAPYRHVKETVYVVIEEKIGGDIIRDSEWKRNGYLHLDLSQIPSYDATEGTVVNVLVTFYRYDANGNKIRDDKTYVYGNQGLYDNDFDIEEKEYHVQLQEGTPCDILINAKDFYDLQLRLKAEGVAYNDIYLEEWGWNYAVNGAYVTVICNGYTSEEYDISIAPVDFIYRKDGVDGNTWTTVSDSLAEDKVIYATVGNENTSYNTENNYYAGPKYSNDTYKTYRVYYELIGGWYARKNNAAYVVDDSKFVCMIDGAAGYRYSYRGTTKTHYYNDYVKVSSGSDDYGYYIDVKIPDSFAKYYRMYNKTLTLVYEGNVKAGVEDNDYLEQNRGCVAFLDITFKGDNIDEEYYTQGGGYGGGQNKPYTLSVPSTEYCPSEAELKSAGYKDGSYYYISPTERFLVRIKEGRYYITLEDFNVNKYGENAQQWMKQWSRSGNTIWLGYSSNYNEWQYSSVKIY